MADSPFARAEFVPPERRRPVDPERLAWLEEQVGDWRGCGLIEPAQAKSILTLYETRADHAAHSTSWFILTLLSLAGLLVGAAVLLLVSYNWQALPALAKLALIFGSIASAHAAGVWLRERAGRPQLASVAFFLGCLLYGAGIWLVAQVFHIQAHYPDGFFWWAVGVLPFALLLDSVLLHALLVGVLGIWITTEIAQFGHLGAVLFGWRWGIPNGCYAAAVMAGLGLASCYRQQSRWGLWLYVPLLAYWTIWQPIAWRFEVNPAYFVGCVGALLLVAAESHPHGSRQAIPYRLFGALLFGGALAPLSNFDFVQWSWRGNQAESGTVVALATVMIAAVGGVLAGCEAAHYFLLEQGRTADAAWLEALRRRQWAPLLMAVAMIVFELLGGGVAAGSVYSPTAELLAFVSVILANIAMLGLALWLISVGLREQRMQPFAGGTVYFLLWVWIRYIDLGNASMVGAAVLFLFCAAVLAGMAWFWMQRRPVVLAEGRSF